MIGLIFILPLFIGTCFSEAVTECSIKTLDLKPEISIENLFDDSLKAFYERRLEKATEGFGEIIKCGEEPWRRRSIFMLGRTYLESGKREEARDFFLKAIAEYNELADYSLYYLSESLLAEKEYERSAEVLRLLYKTYPESPLKRLAQFKEAESLYLFGKYKEAIRAFEIFLEENPKNPVVSEAKLYKGKALKEAGMMDEAADTFKRLWIEDPASASADKAVKELVSVKLNAEDYIIRAENLFKASQYSKAILDLQKALDLEQDPRKISKIRLKTGIALFRIRRYDEAIEIINNVLNQQSGVNNGVLKEALFYLAKVYLRKGNKDSFFRTSYEYYRLYPEDKKTPEVLLILADELKRSGGREKALTIYNLIINEYPEASADALYQRGWMEYLSGDFEKSSKDMGLLVEKYPESQRIPQALYWEARGYEKSGYISKAEAIYRNIINEYPATFYGYTAVERLKKREEGDRPKDKEDFPPLSPQSSPISEIAFPKVKELKTLGMKEEAVAELDYIRYRHTGINQTDTIDLESLIKIGEAYINLEEYNRAISMAQWQPLRKKDFLYLSYPLGFWNFLGQSSNETMLDPYLLAAVIREESRFDPKATSRAGAMGLMQIINSTWDWISKQRDGIEPRTLDSERRTQDPFDPQENIARGSWYLRYLLDRFNRNLIIALSAYNAGPEAVSSWIRNGPEEPDEFIEEIPYKETKAYIKGVLRSYGEYRKIYNSPVWEGQSYLTK